MNIEISEKFCQRFKNIGKILRIFVYIENIFKKTLEKFKTIYKNLINLYLFFSFNQAKHKICFN